jgi:tetratricopeptide (TPR) repeat protein
MRHLILAALASLLFTTVVGAADNEDRPIPQDTQWRQKRIADSLAWNRRTLVEAYDKVGKKDPRWDKPAREALEAAARYLTPHTDQSTKVEEIYEPAKRAIDGGCDDPLILYLFARSSYKPNHPGRQELEKRYVAAAAAMKHSTYPPLRRKAALQKAAEAMASRKDLSPQQRKEAIRLLDEALALLPKSLEQDERNFETDNLQFELPTEIVETLRRLNFDYQAAFDHVDAILAEVDLKIEPLQTTLKAIRLQTRGIFLICYGWEARGSGFAKTVTEEGWKKFDERLTEARKVLNESWELKPNDYRTAKFMLMVEKGIGGDRDEMERWFERAMKANPMCKSACEQKLDWLDPKWHGSLEDMMAFGRACRDTKNWESGITLLLADAHFRASVHMTKQEQIKYLHSQQVREDIKSVYEEYLKHYPGKNAVRSLYAAYCFVCGLYTESDKQFKILGDNFYYSSRWPKKWMEQARSRAAERAAKEKEKPAK